MPNWKAPGKDGVQCHWIMKLSNLHGWIAIQMKKILMGDNSLPVWMTLVRTVLCQKDPRKSNAAENYPIPCLTLMWNLLTGVTAKEMYNRFMAWIDYKKANDFKCMELFVIADNVRNFLKKYGAVEVIVEDLGEVDVKRDIIQGDSISPLLFVLSMVPLLLMLRK